MQHFPKDWNITFNLFKPNESQEQIVFDFEANDTTIRGSGFDPKLKTKFIVHGWTSGLYKTDMFNRYWMKVNYQFSQFCLFNDKVNC